MRDAVLSREHNVLVWFSLMVYALAGPGGCCAPCPGPALMALEKPPDLPLDWRRMVEWKHASPSMRAQACMTAFSSFFSDGLRYRPGVNASRVTLRFDKHHHCGLTSLGLIEEIKQYWDKEVCICINSDIVPASASIRIGRIKYETGNASYFIGPQFETMWCADSMIGEHDRVYNACKELAQRHPSSIVAGVPASDSKYFRQPFFVGVSYVGRDYFIGYLFVECERRSRKCRAYPLLENTEHEEYLQAREEGRGPDGPCYCGFEKVVPRADQ